MDASNEPSPMFLRKRTGLTQVQLAAKIGRSPSTVAKWEARDMIPRLTPLEMKRLCQAYGCTFDELVDAFEGKSADSAPNTTSALDDLLN